jgi:hypothetical protein
LCISGVAAVAGAGEASLFFSAEQAASKTPRPIGKHNRYIFMQSFLVNNTIDVVTMKFQAQLFATADILQANLTL